MMNPCEPTLLGGALPNPGPTQHPTFLWRTFLLAATGQAFLAQASRSWTLFPGLLLFGAAVAVLYYSFPDDAKKENKPKPLSLSRELFLFTFILLAAFFFRICDIDSLPAGMHTDQGLTGLCALRILHEGWRPFGEVFDYQVPEILLFYQLAAWFALVGSSYFTFHLFFILLSLAAFPFVYWTIRQWAGQRPALLSLFILAVMRWNWIETRNGYPSIQVPFYLFAALAFWAYWIKSRKKWAFILSALFVGIGFYSYQAFKIVPLLMAIYAAYEFFLLKKKIRNSRPFLSYFLIVLTIVLPLLTVMVQKGILGHREADLFIGTKIVQEHSLKPLWDVWTGTLLMFNRSGDLNPRHNIPGMRMLDDITAVFFILGLALAWRRRKEREGFYPLAGFGVMLLTGLLSTDPAHSNRLVSLTPFVAYFAGSAFVFFWNHSKAAFKKSAVPAAIGTLLLAGMTAQNTLTYFVGQAEDPRCREAFGVEQTFIGKSIESLEESHPSNQHYFVDSFYFANHTVQFLSYPAHSDVMALNLQDWAGGRMPKDNSAILYLGSEKSGWVDFLKTLFPTMLPPDKIQIGKISIYGCVIQKNLLGLVHPWERGLQATYLNATDWNGKPVTVQTDPVLNFTSKFDFPFTSGPPFRIRWTGSLEISKVGEYQFQVLTTDNAQLRLDGKSVVLEKPFRLATGPHKLRLDFEKDSGDSLALNFIWKKPGDDKWEVVPATAFGKIIPK